MGALPIPPQTKGRSEMALCTHLEDYAAQFRLVEAAYRQCVGLVDGLLAEGPGDGRAQQVAGALAAWRAEDAKLRDLLLAMVRDGRVRVPRRLARTGPHQHRGAGVQGTMICATCRRTVPRLRYAEWQFAHNGTATFRGRELSSTRPATV